jgi:hypothetical protein
MSLKQSSETTGALFIKLAYPDGFSKLATRQKNTR